MRMMFKMRYKDCMRVRKERKLFLFVHHNNI